MSTCPNPNTPEWKALVAALGSVSNAMTAYALNGNEIPSIEEALAKMSHLKTEEKDEQLSKSSDGFKLERAIQQRISLEKIKLTANVKQKETLDKFIQMNDDYQVFLRENLERIKNGQAPIKTISVSNFIGSSDFKGDPKEYEAFKLFGTFMHEVLELAQVEALESNRKIHNVLTREFFDAAYAKYTAKNPFYIEDFSHDIMYDSALEIARQVPTNSGYVIVPEVSIVGTAKSGSKIIGRVDLMLIDINGGVKVFDFKTKKVSDLVDRDPITKKILDTDHADRAFVNIASKHFPVTPKAGTANEFMGQNRTAYDAWTLQLKVYENILKQNNIAVEDQSIVAFIYQVDQDKKYMGSVIHVFEGDNFYDYATTARVPDNNGVWVSDPISVAKSVDSLRNVVDKEIPTSETIQDEQLKKELKILDFQPKASESEELMTRLEASVQTELDEIYQKLSDLKEEDDAQLREILDARKQTLLSFKSFLNRADSKTDKSYAINFSLVMESLQEELQTISEVSEKAIDAFRENGFSKSQKELKEIREAFAKSRGLFSIIDVLRSAVNDARSNKENNITEDSDVMKKLTLLDDYNETIESNFREIGVEAGLAIIKSSVDEKSFNKVNDEFKEVKLGELHLLEKKLEDLKNGKAAGLFTNIKSKTLSYLSAEYKAKLAVKIGPGGVGLIDEVEDLERQIKRMKIFLNEGLSYSDEALRQYITGVTNPGSDWYIGSQDLYSTNSFVSGLGLDRGIASASNSDLMTSAFTQFLKNTDAVGRKNFMDSMAKLQLDQKLAKLTTTRTIDQINDAISETREVTFTDRATKTTQTKNELNFVKLSSPEYDAIYTRYNRKTKEDRKAVALLKAEYNEKLGTPEAEAAKQVLTDKMAEVDKFKTEYIHWLKENANLPYVDAFYEIQAKMPEEIRDALQQKYLEIQTITFGLEKGDNVDLEDHEFDELMQLQDDIRVLRNKAKKMNPEYAAYVDEFNSLFKHDVNNKYFDRAYKNAKSKYAEHPDLWEKWLKRNTVTRPNEAWYTDMNDLYERREALFGSDADIKALMDERRLILSAHKIAGRINPQFLTPGEITELDRIEVDMFNMMEKKKTQGRLTGAAKEESDAISSKLAEISKQQISPAYKSTFDAKFKHLRDSQKLMVNATERLKSVKETGTSKEIQQATEDVDFYEGQFGQTELEFEEWYNLNHNNKYVSVLTGHDVAGNVLPKSFNFEKMPTEQVYEKYMDVGVPGPKFTIRIEKEAAKNPFFIESPDGIPLPKNVYKDSEGHYAVMPGTENKMMTVAMEDGSIQQHPVINSKYLRMREDKEVFDFYNDMTKYYFDLQNKVEGTKSGYRIPGIAATLVENIARDGVVKAMDKQWTKFIDKSVKTYGSQDVVNNTFGDLGNQLRQRFVNQLPEELQTKDAIGAVLSYAVEAHQNIAMQESVPKADGFIEYMELQASDIQEKIQSKSTAFKGTDGEIKRADMSKKLSELKNAITLMKYERQKFFYGQYDNTSSQLNRKLTKVVNNIFAYTSFIRIGFDVANQAKNYLSGNVQAFIAAGGMESDHYSREDYMWAKKQVYGTNGFLSNYFADWGKISDVHESTLLYRFFNPSQKDFSKYVQDITDGRSRRIAGKLLHVSELGYLLQDKGDTEIAVSVMYAVMNKYKFRQIASIDPVTGVKTYDKDADGKDVLVPAHAIYIKDKQGVLVKRADVEYTTQDEDRIRNIIYSEMRRAQGNYSKSDQTQFESNIAGKLVFFFKKYLVPQFLNRFGYLRPNWEASEAAMGYWRAVAVAYKQFGPQQVLKHMVLGSKAMNKSNTNMMGPMLTRRVSQARRDAITMAIVTMLGMMAMMYVRRKDEDDEELSILEGNAIRVLWGVKGETTSMFPVGGGQEEYIKNFTTLTTYTRELLALKKIGSHSINYGLAMLMNSGAEPDSDTDSAMYQQIWKDAFYSKASGPYEKGDVKLVKDLTDISGIRNFRDLVHPENRIDQLKRNQ